MAVDMVKLDRKYKALMAAAEAGVDAGFRYAADEQAGEKAETLVRENHPGYPHYAALSHYIGAYLADKLPDDTKAAKSGEDGAVMYYRGVYEPRLYARGDVVTRRGVLWFCLKDDSATQPPSDDWQLMMKTK